MLLTFSVIVLAELLFVVDIVWTYKKHKVSGTLLAVGNVTYLVSSIGHVLRCINYYYGVLEWPDRYVVWPFTLDGSIPMNLPFLPNITVFLGDICLFLMTFFSLLVVIVIMLKSKDVHRLHIIIITSIIMILILTLNSFILFTLYKICSNPKDWIGFWTSVKINGWW